MKILIQHGRLLDPASGRDSQTDLAIADGRIVNLAANPHFAADRVIDAAGCMVVPGLIDLAVRLKEPGGSAGALLDSELAAASAGGVTSLVCSPDTDPVLDEPGLVKMLKFRSEKLQQVRVFPLGALTRGLAGETLTELAALQDAGCIAFGQADVALANTQVLLRAMQYAASFGFAVWLRPQHAQLGGGVAASGALATRLGLSGVPEAAEVIALATLIELARATGVRLHVCRLSSARSVAMVAAAKFEGLKITCDISIHQLHLIDADIGYFDSRMRLEPPLRQERDRDALARGLLDGTIDALVSDHTPVRTDAKTLPFAQAEPGATGLELLLPMALKWARGRSDALPADSLLRALAVLTVGPAKVLGTSLGKFAASAGQLAEGGAADVCVFDPNCEWQASPQALISQGKHTPFSTYPVRGRARCTVVAGNIVFEASQVGPAPQ